MNRQATIQKRLDEILTLWARADRQQRGHLLMERIRLQEELSGADATPAFESKSSPVRRMPLR